MLHRGHVLALLLTAGARAEPPRGVVQDTCGNEVEYCLTQKGPYELAVMARTNEPIAGGTICLRINPGDALAHRVMPGAGIREKGRVFGNCDILDLDGVELLGGMLIGWFAASEGRECLDAGEHEILALEVRPSRPGPADICTVVDFFQEGRAAIGSPVLTSAVTTCNGKTLLAGTRGTQICLTPARSSGLLRGDSNGDGMRDISDPVFTLAFLFLGELPPPCVDAADANFDHDVNISDPIHSLAFLFTGGPAPPDPSPSCLPRLCESLAETP